MAATYQELYRLGIGVQVNNRASSALQDIRKDAQRAWTYVEKLAKVLGNMSVAGSAAKEMNAQAVAMERAAAAAVAASRAIKSQAQSMIQGARAMQQAANALNGPSRRALGPGFHSGLGYAGAMAAQSVGGAGLAAVGEGLHGAMDLEMVLRNIKMSTNASDGQMRNIQQRAYDISNMTAQSVTDSANLLNVMASSGLNSVKQLMAISGPIAKFADVQYLGVHHTPFEKSATWAVQIAHLYQAYTPQKIAPILDQLTKVSRMMPDDLGRYVTQAGYYMPVFRRLGVQDNQSLVLGAFIDRMGLGRGKGGTGLQNFVLQQMGALQLTSHMQGHRLLALQHLGLVDKRGQSNFYRNGHFDAIGSLAQIDKSIDQRTKGLHGRALDFAKQQAIVDIQKALNVTGGRIGFLGTKEAIDQLHQMVELMKKLPGVDKSQASLMDTTWGQYRRFVTNFQSFLIDTMSPWLGDLKNTFSWLADVTHGMQGWVHQNRAAAALIGAAVTAGSVALLGAATAYMYGFIGSIGALARSAQAATAQIALSLADLRAQGIVATGSGAVPVGGGKGSKGGRFIAGASRAAGGALMGATIAQTLGLGAAWEIGSAAAGAAASALAPIITEAFALGATAIAAAIGAPIAAVIAAGIGAAIAVVGLGWLLKILKDQTDQKIKDLRTQHQQQAYLRDMNHVVSQKAVDAERKGTAFARHYENYHAPQSPVSAMMQKPIQVSGDVIVQVPHGTPAEQAEALAKFLSDHYQSSSRVQGDVGTDPKVPTTFGNGYWGGVGNALGAF